MSSIIESPNAKQRKQHYSTVTNKWSDCGANKRACRYKDSPHRYIDQPDTPEVSGGTLAVSVEAEKKSFFKDVFSQLFKPKQPKPSVLELNTPTIEKKTSAKYLSNTPATVGDFGLTKDKKIQVLSEDRIGGPNLYQFGDLTNGVEARKLHEADPLKKFQNGDCGELANDLWNCNPHVEEYYIFATEADPQFGIHQFVKLKDGTYADSLGTWSEQEFISVWKKIDKSVSYKIDEGEPGVPPVKDPKAKPKNPALFAAITEVIESHFTR